MIFPAVSARNVGRGAEMRVLDADSGDGWDWRRRCERVVHFGFGWVEMEFKREVSAEAGMKEGM